MRLLANFPTRVCAASRLVTPTSQAPGSTRALAHVHDVRMEGGKSTVGGGLGRNVFGQPLSLHSTKPLAGFTRSGYCEAPQSDAGNHSVAGILTNEFLDFSAARGNDLRQAGLSEGCKWCLCVSRWKEAFDARTSGEDRKVPRVVMQATNERALERVKLEDLKAFAVES